MSFVFPPLYAILDAALLGVPELPLLQELAQSGAGLAQYRNKRATPRQLFEISARLSRQSSSLGKPMRFIVNDRPDVALLCNAGGVHVGQQDLGVEEARAIVGPDRWVGVSTHTLEQVDAAARTSADYIAFGPIFATTTKERPDPIVGLDGLAAARARTGKPLVAIGGITLERAAETYEAGANSLAVARDLFSTNDLALRARGYLETAVRIDRLSRARGPSGPAPGASR